MRIIHIASSLFFCGLIMSAGIATPSIACVAIQGGFVEPAHFLLTCKVAATCSPNGLCDYTSTEEVPGGIHWQHSCACDNGAGPIPPCNGYLASTSSDPDDPGMFQCDEDHTCSGSEDCEPNAIDEGEPICDCK